MVLRQLLEHADFEQLIYLSSTRVYAGCASADEMQELRVASHSPDHLYNLSKLLGESALLSSGRPGRVARLSNVIGPDMGPVNFVGSVLAQARREQQVCFQTALASAKDYIWIDDVVEGLIAIADRGCGPIYNLAGGRNINHRELADILVKNGVVVTVADGAPVVSFPEIAVRRIADDTGFVVEPVVPKISVWLGQELLNNRPAGQSI